MPGNMPVPQGIGLTMRAYVDVNHARSLVTQRLWNQFFIYLHSALIYWHSKKQTSVETLTFRSKFMAMEFCTKHIQRLQFKLQMMGFRDNGLTFVYGDNQSVLVNTTIPYSALNKKPNSTAIHFVQERSAIDEWRTAYIESN